MRLALLCPVHGQSIDHIARQLGNYRVFLSPFLFLPPLYLSIFSQVAEDLQDCFPQIDSPNYMYVFLIRDSDSGEFYQSGANEHQTVGILARKQIKWWMVRKVHQQ